MFQSAHLKGIEPPHMVPETTALSTELQVRIIFENCFSNLDKIYSNIFTLTCKVIFHFAKCRNNRFVTIPSFYSRASFALFRYILTYILLHLRLFLLHLPFFQFLQNFLSLSYPLSPSSFRHSRGFFQKKDIPLNFPYECRLWA